MERETKTAKEWTDEDIGKTYQKRHEVLALVHSILLSGEVLF